jgi:hypothetical protein
VGTGTGGAPRTSIPADQQAIKNIGTKLFERIELAGGS